MTHVSIDGQPEAVKRFFESLALPPEGSVVEVNGRPVARMLPADPGPPNGAVDGWTPERNHRRCDLIDKKFSTGLTAAEDQELAALTAGLRRFVDRVAPLPLEDVRRLHQELLEKATDPDPRP
jgi:hypothetical protein